MLRNRAFRAAAALAFGLTVVFLVRFSQPNRHGPAASAPLPAGQRSGALPDRVRGDGLQNVNAVSAKPTHQTAMAPSEIRIPALGVTASIRTVAVDSNGVLIAPRMPTVVGDWAQSAALDAPSGEVTLVGHVNWSGMSPFAFAKLAYLTPGALIYTSDLDGKQTAWKAIRVYARPKSLSVDARAFLGDTGPRTLALLTCGGRFDEADRSYDDNVYVYATPVPIAES